jgi:hypothetical protein
MQICETGIVAFRRHWKPLIAGTAILATVPLILGDIAQLRLGDAITAGIHLDAQGLPMPVPADQVGNLVTALALVICTQLLASVFLMLAALLASVYVARDYRGEPTTLRLAFDRMLRRVPVALAVWLLTTLITLGILVAAAVVALAAISLLPAQDGAPGGPGAFIALLAVVGAVVGFALVSVRLLVAPVCAVLEPGGPAACLRRSWFLTGDNAWRSFGLVVVVTVTIGVLVAIAGEFVGLLSDTFTASSVVPVATSLVFGLLLGLATAPILPVMETVLYFDLRVRRDGLALGLPGEDPPG